MKGTKYRAGGGANKSTKYFSRGGAALQSEMKANPGMGNMPKSVKMRLGGAVKGTKYKAKGGKV